MYQKAFMSFLDAYCLCWELHPSTLFEHLTLHKAMFDKLNIVSQNANNFLPLRHKKFLQAFPTSKMFKSGKRE